MSEDLAGAARAAAHLLLAAMLGGLLGYERQRHGKAGGLRTYCWSLQGAADPGRREPDARGAVWARTWSAFDGVCLPAREFSMPRIPSF